MRINFIIFHWNKYNLGQISLFCFQCFEKFNKSSPKSLRNSKAFEYLGADITSVED